MPTPPVRDTHGAGGSEPGIGVNSRDWVCLGKTVGSRSSCVFVKCQLLERDATPHTYLMPIQGCEDSTIIVSLKFFLFHYFKSSLLEFNCFTMFCWFLQYNKVNQLSVQSVSRVQLFATPWTEACQASLSITNSWSLLKLMSIKLVMPSKISSSVVPFSSCLQSFPALASFPMSQFFPSGGQSIGVSASASVLPMNIQD